MAESRYRVVLDTSVIVAASRSRRGASAALLGMIGGSDFDVCLSAALALEYEAVLGRKMAHASPDEVFRLVAFLCANSQRCSVRRLRPLVNDPDDDFIAELALSCDCDYLVTFNMRDFKALAGRGVRVCTPREFLAKLRDQS